MKVAASVLLAFWIACAALVGLIAGTLAVVPVAMEQHVPPAAVPWLFTGIAISASTVAAVLARLIPFVARAYSLRRVILAGCVGWPLAWWAGSKTIVALESAGSHGIFAISATIQELSVWMGFVAAVAVAVLSVRRGTVARPAAAPSGS